MTETPRLKFFKSISFILISSIFISPKKLIRRRSATTSVVFPAPKKKLKEFKIKIWIWIGIRCVYHLICQQFQSIKAQIVKELTKENIYYFITR